MKKLQWKRLAIWLLVMVMAVANIATLVMAEEDMDPPITEEIGEEVNSGVQEQKQSVPPAVPAPQEGEKEPSGDPNPGDDGEDLPPEDDDPLPPAGDGDEGWDDPQAIPYTVRFEYAVGGTKVEFFTVTVWSDQILEQPEVAPAVAGYAFAYWYDSAVGPDAAFSFGGYPEGDLVLVALLKEVAAGAGEEALPEDEDDEDFEPGPSAEDVKPAAPAVYGVWFLTPSGRILLEYQAVAGTIVELPAITLNEREGRAFAFWYEVGAAEVAPFEFGQALTGDLVLAAYFIAVEEEEEEAELPPLVASITSNVGELVYAGDVITLTAHVSEWTADYECASLWRYFDGEGWVVVATDTLNYSFVVDAVNFYWTWEFVFTVQVDKA